MKPSILDRIPFVRSLLQWRRPPAGWIALHAGGVVAALEGPVREGDVRLRVRFDPGPTIEPTMQPLTVVGGTPFAHAFLGSDLFKRSRRCTVTVTAHGRSHRARFEIGPEQYCGRIDGVRDYHVKGWVSPLFATTTPRVRLVVDGVDGEPVPLDRYRREFAALGIGQGGWNGFSLPLPAHALDGRPHRLAVRAGRTLLDCGVWSALPKYNIDTTTRHHVTGWFFDRAIDDAPTTLRIVRDGLTRSEVKTHSRDDVEAVFGRRVAGFVFQDQDLRAGSELVAGPEGTGIVLGTFGDDGLAPIKAQRARARAHLLGSHGPDADLTERRAIRARLVGDERARTRESVDFHPVLATESGPAPARGGEGPSAAPAEPGAPPPVCAIVPVYKGLSDLVRCIESLLPQLLAGRVRAVIINDASPDPEIGRYLARVAALDPPGVTILDNPRNLGFIGTVNRGFALLAPGEDALLVNADTILPPGAVERLARHCHARPGIASVTPMSNNATILSFPSVASPNPPALGLDVAEIDGAFAARGAAPVEIPTGIGFCMHLNRSALDEVGTFSPEWGRGYCEEVDWCLAARDLGWIHLAATDVFVVHEGSVSFGVAERSTILATNHVRLESLYPEYMTEVRAFMREDPLEDLRTDVLLRLLSGRFRHLTLHLTHGLGGGTKRYVDDLQALDRAPDHETASLMPVEARQDDPRLSLTFQRCAVSLTLRPERIERALAAIEADGVAILLHVNSRLTFHSTFLKDLLSGRRPYVVMLHDFQWYCPRVHLTDERSFYCGEPAPAVCQMCVSGGVAYDFADQDALIEHDLERWLVFNEGLLRGATRLLAPSQDTAARYRRRFDLPDIVVVPHPEPPRPPASARPARSTGSLRIAVVGAIGRPKGLDILIRMVARAARDRLPFFLSVIGYTADDGQLVRYENAEVTGAYAPGELAARLAAIDPDFVFLPSVWPETYSYVLSEVWEAGYPVVAFDIGAPADRIRSMGGGAVIPLTRDAPVILDALLAARSRLTSPMPLVAAVPSLEAYYRHVDAQTSGAGGRASVDLPPVHEISRAQAGLAPFHPPVGPATIPPMGKPPDP